MGKLSKETLLKMCDELADLAKKEIKKADPRTGLPGTLINKDDPFHFDQQKAPSPSQMSGAVRQAFGSSAPAPSPKPEPAKKTLSASEGSKKEQHADLASKLGECLKKCGYGLKKQGGSIQAGIAAAGGGGNRPINPGVASALGGAFGKKELEKAKKDEKGVHQGVLFNPGRSEAGQAALAAQNTKGSFHGTKHRENIEHAKEQHNQKLKELKEMPKPNLPKNEDKGKNNG